MKNKYSFLLIILFITISSFSQIKDFKNVNIDDLIEELQVMRNSNDIEMVWWMPKEYWEVIFAQDETVNEREAKEIMSLLEDYTYVIIIKGKVGLFGGITYASKEDIINQTKIYYNGDMLKMIPENKTPSDLLNFVGIMKPMMKNMLGQMGENMQFLIFENDKKNPVNPLKKGTFSYQLSDFEGDIDLPVSSFLLEKQCSEDNKLYNGKWNYCPFHGTQLTSKTSN